MTRRKFPNRRTSFVLHFNAGKIAHQAGFSMFNFNAVGEIFISSSKPGTGADASNRDAAILASLALQQGSTIEELHASLTKDQAGAPATIIGSAIELVMHEVARIRAEFAATHEEAALRANKPYEPPSRFAITHEVDDADIDY